MYTTRETTDPRVTNKNAELTFAELDANLIALLDALDAYTDQLELSAGGVYHGFQEEVSSTNWNGTSPVIEVDVTDNTATITLMTENAVQGNRVTISDNAGNASSNNITIQGEGGEKIDGSASKVLSSDYASVTLQCMLNHADVAFWKIINEV